MSTTIKDKFKSVNNTKNTIDDKSKEIKRNINQLSEFSNLDDLQELHKNLLTIGLKSAGMFSSWLNTASRSQQNYLHSDSNQQKLNTTKNFSPKDRGISNILSNLDTKTLTSVDPLGLMQSWQKLCSMVASNPDKLLDFQKNYNKRLIQLWLATFKKNQLEKKDKAPTNALNVSNPNKDNRKSETYEESWSKGLIFEFISRNYLITKDSMFELVQNLSFSSDKERKRYEFIMKQAIEVISPKNFIITNPDLLKATLEEKGQNLVRGFDNLFADLLKGGGKRLKISRSENSFVLGGNMANTKGKVVFRNKVMELIQYQSKTNQVKKIPLLIVPPWINKYYILDLVPEKSYINWCAEQGFTVFCISWINPDIKDKNMGVDDYLSNGIIQAVDIVKEICQQDTIHAVGYCMGGSLLSVAVAWYADNNEDSVFASLTLFTTLLDFSDSGEIEIFLEKDFVEALDKQVEDLGYMEGHLMETAFSCLKSKELIWNFVVNNYLYGKTPTPFDMLFWNSDSTRNTVAMYKFFIHTLYLKNSLCSDDSLIISSRNINIGTIKTSTYILAAKEDHIAPWKSCFKNINLLKRSNIRFILSESGHIAGVINAPKRNKYGWWQNNTKSLNADDWFDTATHTKGSWWIDWISWIDNLPCQNNIKELVKSRDIGSKKYIPLINAPGEYVKKNYSNAIKI